MIDSIDPNNSNSDEVKPEKKHFGFWDKFKRAGIFFVTGPFISAFGFIKSVITGDHPETLRSGIEGGALLVEGVGFGSFVKRIKNSKIFQAISNGIEFIFPKPVRTIIAVGCGIASITLTGGSALAIASLVTTCLSKAYTTYKDIVNYTKLRSRTKEFGLATKQRMIHSEIVEQANLIKALNPNIDIEKIVGMQQKSISGSLKNSIIDSEDSSERMPGSNILLSFGENLGTFSTSISAGIAMTTIRAIGATPYAEIKNEEMNKALKIKLENLRDKIPPYKNIEDLTNQTNDQIFFCEALLSLKIDQAFLNAKDDLEGLSILNKKMNELKKLHEPVIKMPELPSKWEAFKETQSASTNYGNITNSHYIEQEEKQMNLFKDKLIEIDSKIKEEDQKKSVKIDFEIKKEDISHNIQPNDSTTTLTTPKTKKDSSEVFNR